MAPEETSGRPGPGAAEGLERRILEATELLLGGRGVEDLTLEDVGVASGLGTDVVLRYFPSVDRIAARLLTGFVERLDTGSQWLTAPPDEDLRPLIWLQARNVAEIYAKHGAVIAALAEATARTPEVRALWNEVIERRVARVAARLGELGALGVIRPVDGELVAGALVLMVHHTMVRLYRHRSEVPVEEAAETLFTVWSRTILPDEDAPAA